MSPDTNVMISKDIGNGPPHFVRIDRIRYRMGKISRRPMSISVMLVALRTVGKAAKLDIDPTSPKPGPTLPMQATEAVTPVVKSRPKDRISVTYEDMVNAFFRIFAV